MTTYELVANARRLIAERGFSAYSYGYNRPDCKLCLMGSLYNAADLDEDTMYDALVGRTGWPAEVREAKALLVSLAPVDITDESELEFHWAIGAGQGDVLDLFDRALYVLDPKPLAVA